MNDEHLNRSIKLYGDDIGCVKLIQHYGTDLTVVNAARVSFGIEHQDITKRDKKLIKYLIEHKHTSTLEHCGATFKFIVPLFIRSQHHRHRTWSYNEISRRYTDIDMRFYEPNVFRTQHETNRQASNESDLIDPKVSFQWDESTCGYTASEAVKELHQGALYLYESLIIAGVCREQARGVLPQNLYTEYYGTVNLSNLLKFINLRTHEGAQWEIQKVAEALLTIAKELWPATINAYEELAC